MKAGLGVEHYMAFFYLAYIARLGGRIVVSTPVNHPPADFMVHFGLSTLSVS